MRGERICAVARQGNVLLITGPRMVPAHGGINSLAHMPHEFECRVIRETEQAILVEHLESEEEIWIPLSLVHEIHKNKNNEGTIVIETWFAKKLGIV